MDLTAKDRQLKDEFIALCREFVDQRLLMCAVVGEAGERQRAHQRRQEIFLRLQELPAELSIVSALIEIGRIIKKRETLAEQKKALAHMEEERKDVLKLAECGKGAKSEAGKAGLEVFDKRIREAEATIHDIERQVQEHASVCAEDPATWPSNVISNFYYFLYAGLAQVREAVGGKNTAFASSLKADN